MTNSVSEYHFNLIKESLVRELGLLDNYKIVNDFLCHSDWLFISPIFFQGFELDYFLELIKKKENQKESINKLIFSKFYNLNWTASFIDGYCARCNHISPFLKSIEHSLILTFQKDYEGSIKTLIPIIEGILRQYLFVDKGVEMNKIKFANLKNSFNYLKSDLISVFTSSISHYLDENNRSISFNQQQTEELIKLQSSYYDVWFSFIVEFINKSFYLKTDGGEGITNEINRHAIAHEFGLDIIYNLENYIKIYFVLQFLTWVFLRKENKSSLNNINPHRFLEKAISYKKIIELSEKLIYEKHLLLKDYKGYDPE